MRRIGVLLPATADDANSGLPRRVPSGTGAIGLDHRPQRPHQHPLGYDQCRRIRRHAAELAALAPEVVLAFGASAVGPMVEATRTIPIVFPAVVDPVGAGFVASLNRPGGNATRVMSLRIPVSAGSGWSCFKEIAPTVTRAAVLRDPAITSGIGLFGVIQAMASSLRMEVTTDQFARRRPRARLRHSPAPRMAA